VAWVERYVSSLASGGTGTEVDPWDLVTARPLVAPGDRVNIKDDGPYSAFVSWYVDGTDTQGIWLRGYGTTIGDGVRPQLQGMELQGDGYILSDVDIVNTLNNYALDLSGNKCSAHSCSITQNYNATWRPGVVMRRGVTLEGCDVAMNGGSIANNAAIYFTSGNGGGSVIGCRVVMDTTGTGCNAIDGGGVGDEYNIVDCEVVCKGTSESCVMVNYNSANFRIVGNTFYGANDAGVYISLLGSTSYTNCELIANNLFHTCANGIYNSSPTVTAGLACLHNAMYSITSAQFTNIHEAFQIGTVTVPSDPCIDAANGDMRLNSVADGGALVRAAALTAPELL